jgi:hypothetical protein
MKMALRVALLILGVVAAVWLWTVVFPSPEKIVLRRIAGLAATATISPGEGAIMRAGKTSSFIGYFSTDAEISYDLGSYGTRTISGRDEIRELAAGAFTTVGSLNVQFVDATARVAADKQSAEATCTARVTTGDNKDFDVQELKFQLKRIDGDWLITRAETVKTLQ